jgi:DNA-binding transcriptional LysR family regulator
VSNINAEGIHPIIEWLEVGTVLETSHLRCFVAVADEMHFGRAAARLNMTQPPLSRQIQLLERALHCELFVRNSRSVQMTQAGATFLPEARRILRLIENASKTALDVAAGRRGLARCGFTASAAYEFLPSLVARMREVLPDAELTLREMVSRAQATALDAGEVEIGLLRILDNLTSYEHRTVANEPLMVALPMAHPLARKEKLKWTDLHRQDFIMYESKEGQYFYSLVASRLILDEVYPNIVQQLVQIHTMLALVRARVGIAVVPASATMMGVSDVVYRDFDDPHAIVAKLYVVWHPETQNPLVPTLAELAVSCGSHSASWDPGVGEAMT